MEKNWSYKIPDGPHAGKVLWSGRYCAVAAFVFRRIEGIWSVLANKRGPGAPDYRGCWNAVCGFLEANETARQCCSREIFEETGYIIEPEKFLQVYTQTDPETSNNGNVTLRHIAIIFDEELKRESPEGGEAEEVDDVKWIPINEICDYEWAFNHDEVIPELFHNFVFSLIFSSDITDADHLILSNQEWLDYNPQVKEILKKKVSWLFNIYG